MNLSHPFAPTPPLLVGDDTRNAPLMPHPELPWSSCEAGRALVTDVELHTTAIHGPGTTRIFMAEAQHAFYRLYLLFALQLRKQPKNRNFMPRIVAFANMNADALAALAALQEQERLRLVVFRPKLDGTIDATALKALITANTVLVTFSLIGQCGTLQRADDICACALSQYKTPVHADVTLAAAIHRRQPSLLAYFKSHLQYVQCFSADLSYSCLLDAHLLFARDAILDGYKLDLRFIRENPAAAVFLYKYGQWLATCPYTLPLDGYFLQCCQKAFADSRVPAHVITYAQYEAGGALNALVTLNDINDKANWMADFIAFALVRNGKVVAAKTVQTSIMNKCGAYAHASDVSKCFATTIEGDPIFQQIVLITATHDQLPSALAACFEGS